MAEPEPQVDIDKSTEVAQHTREMCNALDIPCVNVLGLPDTESPMTIRDLTQRLATNPCGLRVHIVSPFPHSDRLGGTSFGSSLVSVFDPPPEKKGGRFLVPRRPPELYCFLSFTSLRAKFGGQKMAALLGSVPGSGGP